MSSFDFIQSEFMEHQFIDNSAYTILLEQHNFCSNNIYNFDKNN